MIFRDTEIKEAAEAKMMQENSPVPIESGEIQVKIHNKIHTNFISSISHLLYLFPFIDLILAFAT